MDASFVIHEDITSRTGLCTSLGKGMVFGSSLKQKLNPTAPPTLKSLEFLMHYPRYSGVNTSWKHKVTQSKMFESLFDGYFFVSSM